jgi:hypothetical protein
VRQELVVVNRFLLEGMRSLSRSGSSRCTVAAHWIALNATVPWLVRHGVLCAFPASVCVCVLGSGSKS